MTSGPHPPPISTATNMRLTPTLPTAELPVTYPEMPAESTGIVTADAGNVRTDGTGMAPTPDAEPLSPPSGPITDRAPCCPDVATFEGSTGGWQTYFGFDDKTNSVKTKGQDEYWSPPGKNKSLPGDKETRDGARWVSVAVGQEAQVEVNFGGTFTNGCLSNCTYEVDPANIAEVTSPQPTHSGAALKIKGLSEGEASLKVMCNGELKGYFHIWCKKMAFIKVDLANMISARTGKYGKPNIEKYKKFLRKVFRQAAIDFDFQDLGDVDLGGDSEFVKFENKYYNERGAFDPPGENIWEKAVAFNDLGERVYQEFASGSSIFSRLFSSQKQPRRGAIQLFFYIPDKRAFSIENKTTGIYLSDENPRKLMLVDTRKGSEFIVAHELGHALGLEHPNAGVAETRKQYPPHHLASIGGSIEGHPATNTEPAEDEVIIPPENRALVKALTNYAGADPRNLMGYHPYDEPQMPLRYRQWKNCKRK